MIAGAFILRSFSLFSLVDSGSTHSYIVSDLAGEFGIPVETIRQGIIVISSLGESVIVDRVYQRCPLTA